MLDFDWDKDIKPQVRISISYGVVAALTFVIEQPHHIKWKRGKNLCERYPKEEDDGEITNLGSFFNWFEAPSDPFDVRGDKCFYLWYDHIIFCRLEQLSQTTSSPTQLGISLERLMLEMMMMTTTTMTMRRMVRKARTMRTTNNTQR
jgi:hypothetical protein